MVASRAIPMKRLQATDKRLGWLVCALLQPWRWLRARPRVVAEPRRILCIKFWGIGSLQMLTPAIAHLRAAHPGARVELLTLAENEAFARGLELFDGLHTLDVQSRRGPLGWARLVARILALVRRLRRERFDALYDFEFFTRFSALVTLAAGAPATHGFAAPTVWRGGFHARTVPFNRYWHVARNFRALAGGEDGSDVLPGDLQPFRVTAEHRQGLERALERAGLDATRPLAVLNPNAGQLSLERRWPAPNFAQVARTLAQEDGLQVVLVGAPGEAEYVAAIAAAAGEPGPGRIADLAGQLSIGELAALLAQADVLVTNDSGPMHVAAALGTPLVALFGPETPVMYGPLGVDALALWKPPACSPCINVHENKVANCIHGRPECLVGLDVERVLDEARGLLADGLLRGGAQFPRRRLRVVQHDGGARARRAEAGE